MKRIIYILLTLSVIVTAQGAALAVDGITADEVRELIEASTLLSRQDFCDEVLDFEVYDRENLLEGKKPLRDCIDPDKTFIYSVSYYDMGAVMGARLETWDDDGNARNVYLNKRYYGDDADSYIRSYLSEYTDRTQIAYEYYNNCEHIAALINEAGLKDISFIRFDSIIGMEIFVGTDIYVVRDDKVYTLDDYFKASGTARKEISDAEDDIYEKKRALTPQDMLDREDWVGDNLSYEGERVLRNYESAEPAFLDLGDDKFLVKAAALLKDKGIITGFEDGTFRPDSILTRGEAAVMLNKLVKGDFTDGAKLADMDNHWACDAVNRLTAANVIHGYDDGMFHPERTLTYEHAVNLLYEIMGYTAERLDTTERPNQTDAVYTMMTDGLFEGMDSFVSGDSVTRAAFVKMLANAMDMYMHTIYAPIDWNMEPKYYAVASNVTLAGYLGGREIKFGDLRVSEEAYKRWIDDYIDLYFTLYDSIIDEETKAAYGR